MIDDDRPFPAHYTWLLTQPRRHLWKSIADHETLVRLAVEVGLAEEQVREVLTGDGYARDVREDELAARDLRISAVPTFIVDRAVGTSGAHPPEALLELLRQGWSRSFPVAASAAGETCDVDGCR